MLREGGKHALFVACFTGCPCQCVCDCGCCSRRCCFRLHPRHWSCIPHADIAALSASVRLNVVTHARSSNRDISAGGVSTSQLPLSGTHCPSHLRSASLSRAVAALHQGTPGQTTWLEDPSPWLRPAYCFALLR